MIKALIFDFDGVLVSSETPRFNALKMLLEGNNIGFPSTLRAQMPGKTTQSILEKILPDNNLLVERLMKEYREKFVQDITKFVDPIKFTTDFIRNYQGNLPIAIASMSAFDAISKLTKHFEIYNKITQITSREDVTLPKPNPEIYLKAATKLKVEPEDCLVFEDTALGAQSAIEAGMDCCIVLNGENNKNETLDLPIKAYVSTSEDFQKLFSQVE